MADDFTGLLAEVERATTLDQGVIAFLEGLPSGTTVADAVVKLRANSDAVAAALAANVPPAPPAP